MKDVLVILNPAANSEKALKQHAGILRMAKGANILTTKAPGHAREMAAWAVENHYRKVVVAGGDGTINEAVNGLAGSDVILGILPVGTMNVFATELELPEELEPAWEVALGGETRQVDLAEANGQIFVQLAGVGLDAQAVEATTWESKKTLGPLSYVLNAAHIASRVPPVLRVETGSEVREGSFVLVGNGRYYGGRVIVFQDASLYDGLLDVLIFKNLGYLDIARYLAGVVTGTHTDMDDVEYFHTHEIRVTSNADVPYEADGELAGRLPVSMKISQHRLMVSVPRLGNQQDE